MRQGSTVTCWIVSRTAAKGVLTSRLDCGAHRKRKVPERVGQGYVKAEPAECFILLHLHIVDFSIFLKEK